MAYCLLEFFHQTQRWFVTSIKSLEINSLFSFLNGENIDLLIVDCPLSPPFCAGCSLDCLNSQECDNDDFKTMNLLIDDLFLQDEEEYKKNPKEYEYKRQDQKRDWKKDFLWNDFVDHTLTKSLKRRLKKGLVPYWNRSIDLWIWLSYGDLMQNYFKKTYNSYGHMSLSFYLFNQFIQKKLKADYNIYEANFYLILLELTRANVLGMKELKFSREEKIKVNERKILIEKVENFFKIFIYNEDINKMSEDEKSFEAFMLSLTGYCLFKKQTKKFPEWPQIEKTPFIIPSFKG